MEECCYVLACTPLSTQKLYWNPINGWFGRTIGLVFRVRRCGLGTRAKKKEANNKMSETKHRARILRHVRERVGFMSLKEKQRLEQIGRNTVTDADVRVLNMYHKHAKQLLKDREEKLQRELSTVLSLKRQLAAAFGETLVVSASRSSRSCRSKRR